MRTGGCVTWLAESVSGHVPPRVRVPRERRKKWGVAAVIPPSLPPSIHPRTGYDEAEAWNCPS